MTTRRANHPGLDPMAPHAIDHAAYADGTAMPEAMLALEAGDPFWQTLGGSVDDPFGDGGETFRQRQEAIALGIGANLYAPSRGKKSHVRLSNRRSAPPPKA